MDSKTANELDRLLAGDGISGAEADAIFERVLAGVEQDERKSPRRRALWAAGVASAVVGLFALFALRPSALPASGFTARGSEGTAPRLELVCSGGALAACPMSSKLIFVVSGDQTTGFLSAYAEALEPGAERVWYFSKDGERAQLRAVGDGTRVFERAVQLAGTHRPGRYRVHVFLGDAPLGRDEMLGHASEPRIASLQFDLRIVGE